MSENYETSPIGQRRRTFRTRLIRAVHDPSRVGRPAEMLRSLGAVVLDAHELDTDGTCVGHFDSREEQREWPCTEVIQTGRIYGVHWVSA
jgi:hypothetical protein